MKKLLQLATTALLALSTSQANASISLQTNVASIWQPGVIHEPVKGIRGDQAIRDVDVAAETSSMKAFEASYFLLLDLGCTDDEAMMILLFDSVIDVEPPTGVYVEREFE